jgi:hypothetical protein
MNWGPRVTAKVMTSSVFDCERVYGARASR